MGRLALTVGEAGRAGEGAPTQWLCPSRFIGAADWARLALWSICLSLDRRSDAYASACQQAASIIRRWITRARPGNAAPVGANKKPRRSGVWWVGSLGTRQSPPAPPQRVAPLTQAGLRCDAASILQRTGRAPFLFSLFHLRRFGPCARYP